MLVDGRLSFDALQRRLVTSPAKARQLVAAVPAEYCLVAPQPKKGPNSSYLRFEAEQPNETWQSDFTHCLLADGTETIAWLDDRARTVSPPRLRSSVISIISISYYQCLI